MIKKYALDPVTSVAASFISKNLLATAADSIDTHGKPLTEKEERNRVVKNVHKLRHAVGGNIHKFKARAFQAGLLHGIDPTKDTKSPGWQWSQSIPVVGTEHHAVQYNLGYSLGKRYKHLPPIVKRRKLNELYAHITAIPEFRDIPHMAAAADGIAHTLKEDATSHKGRPHKALRLLGIRDTLRDQDRKYGQRLMAGKLRSKFDSAERFVSQAGEVVGKWTDLDRAIVNGIDKIGPLREAKSRFVNRTILRGLKKAGPEFIYTKKDAAKTLALQSLLSPRVGDIGHGSRALRQSLLIDTGRTLRSGAHVAQEFTGKPVKPFINHIWGNVPRSKQRVHVTANNNQIS